MEWGCDTNEEHGVEYWWSKDIEAENMYIDKYGEEFFVVNDSYGGQFTKSIRLAGPFETLEAAQAAYLLLL
jgi:hypothetical protein